MGSKIKELIFSPYDDGVEFMVIGDEKFLDTLFVDVAMWVKKHNDDVRNQTAYAYDEFITDTEFLARIERNDCGETVLSGNISKAFVNAPSYKVIFDCFIEALLLKAGLISF